MNNIFFCLDCDFEFQSPAWNGSAAVCPNCESTRWYDIQEELEEFKIKRKRFFKNEGRLAER